MSEQTPTDVATYSSGFCHISPFFISQQAKEVFPVKIEIKDKTGQAYGYLMQKNPPLLTGFHRDVLGALTILRPGILSAEGVHVKFYHICKALGVCPSKAYYAKIRGALSDLQSANFVLCLQFKGRKLEYHSSILFDVAFEDNKNNEATVTPNEKLINLFSFYPFFFGFSFYRGIDGRGAHYAKALYLYLASLSQNANSKFHYIKLENLCRGVGVLAPDKRSKHYIKLGLNLLKKKNFLKWFKFKKDILCIELNDNLTLLSFVE